MKSKPIKSENFIKNIALSPQWFLNYFSALLARVVISHEKLNIPII